MNAMSTERLGTCRSSFLRTFTTFAGGKRVEVKDVVAEDVVQGQKLALREGAKKGEVEFEVTLKGYDTTVVKMAGVKK